MLSREERNNMKKQKWLSAALAAVFSLSLASGALAAEVDLDYDAATNTASGSSLVSLTAEAATFSVTVPYAIPIHVAATGEVTVGDVTIRNNSGAPVQLDSIHVTPKSPWLLDAWTDYAATPADAKRFCFQINSAAAEADGSMDAAAVLPGPIPAGTAETLPCDARLPARTQAVQDVQIASVLFVVSWCTDTADERYTFHELYDVDGNGQIDADDVDLLQAVIDGTEDASSAQVLTPDYNGDHAVTDADMDVFLSVLDRYDFNVDGSIDDQDVEDFRQYNVGNYTGPLAENIDYDGSGEVNSKDFTTYARIMAGMIFFHADGTMFR